jgi:hypothetical protein
MSEQLRRWDEERPPAAWQLREDPKAWADRKLKEARDRYEAETGFRPTWDQPLEDPKAGQIESCVKPRARDQLESERRLNQQRIDSGEICIGRPRLVPRPNRNR